MSPDGATPLPRRHPTLICAEAGGSNGSRVRAWKVELAKLARETGLEITVAHFPPGTSKWNRIEHRMSVSSWRGRPLTFYRVMVQLIANTTTKKGLKVNAALDEAPLLDGRENQRRRTRRRPSHPRQLPRNWNYSVHSKPLK